MKKSTRTQGKEQSTTTQNKATIALSEQENSIHGDTDPKCKKHQPLRFVIVGMGGHAHALIEQYNIINNCCVVNVEDEIPECNWVLIGVGDIETRKRLWLIHKHKVFERGLQKMHSSFISVSAKIGVNVLVNTGAQIDHDCNVGDHCVISPGAILCGNVTLGESCYVGAGAIILQEVTLPAETFVPAGTLVCEKNDFRKPVPMERHDGYDTFIVRAKGKRVD